MFSEGIIYLIYLFVYIISHFTTPLANIMYYVGTCNFNNINLINLLWNNKNNNNELTVLTWFLHITSAFVFYLLNTPVLNIVYQVFLGTVIQHMLWTAFNSQELISKPHLFVLYWQLDYWDMWSVITVSLLPMVVGIYIF